MITETTVVKPITVLKENPSPAVLGPADYFSRDCERYYRVMRHQPEATVVSLRNNLKVGRLLVSEPDASKNEIIIFDGTSPFAVMVTTNPECEDLDLNEPIGWQITHDRLNNLGMIFTEGNPLMAVIVTNSRYYQAANDKLAVNLAAKLGGEVEVVNVSYLQRLIPNFKFSTSFNAISGELNVYNWTEDRRTSFKTKKLPEKKKAESLYSRYVDYMNRHGALAYEYFVEALTCTPREIFNRHQFSTSGRLLDSKKAGDTFMEAQAIAISLGQEVERWTGVELGPDGWPIWLRFRLIPNGEMKTYVYGWRPPDFKGERAKVDFRKPSDLDGAALLDEVFKITGNELKRKQLANWYAVWLPETHVNVIPLSLEEGLRKLDKLDSSSFQPYHSVYRPFVYREDERQLFRPPKSPMQERHDHRQRI
jgi:hypothetical protein